MDLRLSPTEAAFLERLREWLEVTEPPAGLRDYGATPTLEDLEPARQWQRMLHEADLAGLSWPREHGGADASAMEQALFAEEMARSGRPRQLNLVGFDLAGPAIIRFGTAAQQERFLPPILRGDEIWCQLFSEPEAGSDLVALQTRATPTADGWSAHGHKLWSSGAHYADYGLLLARTDPDGERHSGLSLFLMPMRQTEVVVSPLRQMDGASKFNEVRLEGVRLGHDCLVGELNEGWRIAMWVLGRERRMLGAQAVGLSATLDRLWRRLGEGAARDPGVRRDWAALTARTRLLRLTWLRMLSEAGDDDSPSSVARTSVLKLVGSELQRDTARFAADVLGAALALGEDKEWGVRLLTAPGATIAGGTSEIQRNILADRVLKLPR